MSSTAIAIMIKMLESLPEAAQDQVVEHLREYIEDLQDGNQWDSTFKKAEKQLAAAAQRAKEATGADETDASPGQRAYHLLMEIAALPHTPPDDQTDIGVQHDDILYPIQGRIP